MPLETIILSIPAILLALTIHEFAHGWSALKCGDRTASDAGRLTLNPIAHLDPLGTLCMIGTCFHLIPFGWAKPVPINPANFLKPKRDIMLVSLAGPVSNILLALLTGGILRLMDIFMHSSINPQFHGFCIQLISINLGLSFFNLIPVPPLDGSKVLIGLLPNKALPSYFKNSNYFAIIFIGLLLIEWVANIPTISFVLGPVWNLYINFWYSIMSLGA